MADTSVIPPLPEAPADSFFSRALGVFISPGRAFESIVRRQDFLVPLIIAMVAAFVLGEAMIERIGPEQMVRRSLELSGRAARMSDQQLDVTAHRAAGFTALAGRLAGPIGIPIYLLVIAGVGLFIANLLFSASVNFNTAFSVVCYASLVLQVAVVLGLVMVFMVDPAQFNPGNFVPTTVGFFLDPREVSKPLYVLASSFDIFRVWFIALCSIGLSVATGRRVSTLKIFLTFLGIWIVIVLAHAGVSALTA
jgi:hypothetical protein